MNTYTYTHARIHIHTCTRVDMRACVRPSKEGVTLSKSRQFIPVYFQCRGASFRNFKMADEKTIIEENRLNYDSKEAITDGIIDLLKPSVIEIDDRVRTVR